MASTSPIDHFATARKAKQRQECHFLALLGRCFRREASVFLTKNMKNRTMIQEAEALLYRNACEDIETQKQKLAAHLLK